MTNWELLEGTKKASIYFGKLDGYDTYLVTIGMGKKLPNFSEINFKRDREGQLITKGSWWRFVIRESPEGVKEGAYRLYHNFC